MTADLHLCPDGTYRRCRIRMRSCPYDQDPDAHLSVTQLARRGGGKVADGHGVRRVGALTRGGFWVFGDTRKRAFSADGEPLRGQALRDWKQAIGWIDTPVAVEK